MRQRLLFVIALAGALLVVLIGPSFADETPQPTSAASPSTESGADAADFSGAGSPTQPEPPFIRVAVKDGRVNEPVDGVGVTLTDSSDTVVGVGTTGKDGFVYFKLDANGSYTATIDEKSLPKGIKVKAGNSRTINVFTEQAFAAFDLNKSAVQTTSFGSQLINTTVYGLKYGVILALASLGLSLVFGTTGLTNFAHGELITFGALVAFYLNVGAGVPLIIAGFFAVIAGGAFGYAQDRLLWAPLTRRGTGLIAMTIVSIGFAITLRYTFQYIFGGGTRGYAQYGEQVRASYGPIALSDKEIAIFVISIAVIAIVTTMMARTRMGKAMRAVSDNPALSASSGLRVESVVSWMWVPGTALAALAGVLYAVNTPMDYLLGQKVLLMVFAATTLGGLGTVWGAVIGSLIIGVVTEVGPLFGVPSSIKEVGALVILILILLIRPQGILGRAERVG